eukprot:3634827-Amphidinium_carterae.1
MIGSLLLGAGCGCFASGSFSPGPCFLFLSVRVVLRARPLLSRVWQLLPFLLGSFRRCLPGQLLAQSATVQ